MAKLGVPVSGFEGSYEQQGARLNELEGVAARLKPGDIVGGILKFPVADGYALYLVQKAKPLTVQHIAYGDAYRVHDALLRGLTRADVDKQLEGERIFRDFFAKQKGAQ